MVRKAFAVTLLILFCGVAIATPVATAVHDVNVADVFNAWPATERFTGGILERVAILPMAIAGRVAARRDIERGRLELKLWGLPQPWRRTYADILKQRGIEVCTVAGCVVSQPRLSAWEGYNDVMLAEIARRHGDNVLMEAAERAQAEFAAAR